MPPDEILEELRRIYEDFSKDRTSPEVRSRWWALFHKARKISYLVNADVDDVAWLVSVGWMIEIRASEYRQAADLLRPFFDHPDVERAHTESRVSTSCDLASSLFRMRDETEAVTIWRSLVDAQDHKEARLAAQYTSCALLDCFEVLPTTETASAGLAELVFDLCRRLGRRVSRRARPREGMTYGELYDLLDPRTTVSS